MRPQRDGAIAVTPARRTVRIVSDAVTTDTCDTGAGKLVTWWPTGLRGSPEDARP
jgi:hypothetical protein